MPGPELTVGELKGLRKQDSSEDDPVGVGDQLLELESLDDGAIGGAGREAHHEECGQERAYQPGPQRESKHFLNLGAPTRSVKRSAPHDLD